MKLLIFIILLCLAAASAARAEIIYVQGDVSGAWAADTVVVTGDARVPPGMTLVIEPGVKVLFQGAFKLTIENDATLNANGTETDSIYFDELVPGALWRGLRFSNAANASHLGYCMVRHGNAIGSGENGKGGGIYILNSDILVEHSRIEACIASNAGGGIYCYGSTPVIRGNCISGNTTTGTFGHGGGLYAVYSDPLIIENTITSNSAIGNYGDAGGVYYNGTARVIGNFIAGNHGGSTAGGGGISYGYSAGSTIRGNIILNNSVAYGGGIYCFDGGNAEISGNLIVSNEASEAGGILCQHVCANHLR